MRVADAGPPLLYARSMQFYMRSIGSIQGLGSAYAKYVSQSGNLHFSFSSKKKKYRVRAEGGKHGDGAEMGRGLPRIALHRGHGTWKGVAEPEGNKQGWGLVGKGADRK